LVAQFLLGRSRVIENGNTEIGTRYNQKRPAVKFSVHIQSRRNCLRNALIASGFRVGKDAISTMVNTLVLAYVGSSFPLLMLYQIYQTPYGQIINDEAMAAEIVRMLAGSTGLLAAVPVTVFAAALLSENIAVN
jgi:uncharacterized membrane protein